MNKSSIIALIVLVFVVGIVFVPKLFVGKHINGVACTMEAKQCPDGSYVGRVGTMCEFADCPNTPIMPNDIYAEWKTFTDTKNKVSFQYPDPLPTIYITSQSWPPTVSVVSGKFSCKSGGSAIMQNGKTEQKTINGGVYCVTSEMGGAAGSIYTTYNYMTTKGTKLVTLNFILRAVQCANYPDPKKTECEAERAKFDPDTLANQMISSVKFL